MRDVTLFDIQHNDVFALTLPGTSDLSMAIQQGIAKGAALKEKDAGMEREQLTFSLRDGTRRGDGNGPMVPTWVGLRPQSSYLHPSTSTSYPRASRWGRCRSMVGVKRCERACLPSLPTACRHCWPREASLFHGFYNPISCAITNRRLCHDMGIPRGRDRQHHDQVPFNHTPQRVFDIAWCFLQLLHVICDT